MKSTNSPAYDIYIHSPWKDDTEFLKEITKQTPGESRQWGDIRAIDDLDSADYHIAFNQPGDHLDEKKVIVLPMEPPFFSPDYRMKVLKGCTLSEIYKPQHWWIAKNYDELSEDSPIKKDAKISWITSDKGRRTNGIYLYLRRLLIRTGQQGYKNKIPLMNRGPSDGHILRMDFLDRLERRHPNLIDLYGRGEFTYPNYQGEINDKWNGLAPYKYTLAIENYSGKNYFSEKISDALLSWCMPIYWGCTNIDEYLPEDSYISIDIQDPSAPQEIIEIMNSNLWEENLDAIAEARRRILNQYQIWPTINSIIKNLKGR